MPHRYEGSPPAATSPLQLAEALRRSFAAGYTAADLRHDALAGIVVGIVALPLSMALAVAAGVAPQHGLYTAIVCGGLIALLGGSRVQVSGPTAAFVVILAPISARFGLGGLAIATLMAGALLIALGVIRLGSLIQFVPYPVTTGFTAGIAVVIATLQLKDFLGLSLARMPETYAEKVIALGRALPTWRVPDLAVGAFTLAVLLLWPRVTFHALFVLAAVLALAPLLGYLLMASLAALLLLVAWNMSDVRHFVHAVQVAPLQPSMPQG